MPSPVISVIIPIYNAEKSLADCLDSLKKQTFEDWEAVCVNDGSKDESLTILQKYAELDSRIKFIDKPNAGVSAARNDALAVAQGRYVTMVDSDDVMPPHALQVLIDPIIQGNHVDLVLAGVVDVFIQKGYSNFQGTLYDGNEREGICQPCDIMRDVKACAVAKLFRKSVLDEYAVRYREDVHFGEDHEFVLHYLIHCGAVYVTQQTVYNYIHHGSSASDSFFAGKKPLADYLRLPQCKLDLIQSLPSHSRQTPFQRTMSSALGFIFFKETFRCFPYFRNNRLKKLPLLLQAVLGAVKLTRYLTLSEIIALLKEVSSLYPNAFLTLKRFYALIVPEKK